MKRANIIIKGNVQIAGFRTFIKNIADSFNIKGIAENLADGSVKVICEGEEKGLNGLVKSLKENPPSFSSIVASIYPADKKDFRFSNSSSLSNSNRRTLSLNHDISRFD